MQALQYQGPGKIAWIDAPNPELQHEADVLVRPLAVATCDLDWEILAGRVPFPAPFILGHEFVGEVLTTGSAVKAFSAGDQVCVAFQPSCGHCSPCATGSSAACKSVAPTSMFGVGKVSGDWGGAFAEQIRIPFADNMLRTLPAAAPLDCFPSISDNLADAARCVAGYVTAQSSVLILGGYDSIPLYAVLFAKALGAHAIHYCTKDPKAAANAERLGASVELVDDWPARLPAHEVTVCSVQSPQALLTAIRSTRADGHCTSTSIFAEDIALPLREMYMRGVHLHTGRVNGVSALNEFLPWVADGRIDPLAVDTHIVDFDGLVPALLERQGAKLIAHPNR